MKSYIQILGKLIIDFRVSKSNVILLGTETVDSSPSFLVFFENHRYLFNVGEGLQRLSLEYKAKITKIDHIFVTSTQWKNLGGIPGLDQITMN